MEDDNRHNVKELVLDVYGCQQELASSETAQKSIMVLRSAAERVGATVCAVHCTTYTKHGFTTVALLAESHIILTAWPEYDYASINIYLCNSEMDHVPVQQCIFDFLQPSNWRASWFRHITIPNNSSRIFLAAPFTRYLKDDGFDSHAFEQITQLLLMLRKHGYTVFSAHEREEFGDQLMSSELCTRLDFEEMTQCDIVVAIMSDNSYGVCVELGWASAFNKPIILVNSDKKPCPSPLIEGIGQITQIVNVQQMPEVLKAIKGFQCETALPM